jgi:hypothetical protein
MHVRTTLQMPKPVAFVVPALANIAIPSVPNTAQIAYAQNTPAQMAPQCTRRVARRSLL